MLPVAERFNSTNYSTRLFGLSFSAEEAEEIQEPIQDEGYKLDFGSGWGKMGNHAITLQTERYEGAVEDAINAPDYFASTKGTTINPDYDPEMKPQQLSGLGFDATPKLTAQGYLINQGILAQKIVSTTGMALGAVAIFAGPIPGTTLANIGKRSEETLRRFGLIKPTVA